MLKTTLTFFTWILTLSAIAQYGNEWIDYSKTYYKFGIAEDGVYRIPATTLGEAGLSGVFGTQFRLYRLGEEVAIFTSTDETFGPDDFIEFVGLQNRGEFDRVLYEDADAHQLNPRYSMFTDTAVYFLTWSDTGSGNRIEGIGNDLSNPPAPEPYYMHEDEWVFSDRLLDPRNRTDGGGISYSRYQRAEGFATLDYSTYQFDLPSVNVYAVGPEATLDVKLASSTYTAHDLVALFQGDTLLHGTDGLFRLYDVADTIDPASISASEILDITNHATNARFAIATIHWRYPRTTDFSGSTSTSFTHPGAGVAQYFELYNFDHGNSDPVVIDLDSKVRLICARSGNTVRFLLPPANGDRRISVVRPGDIYTVDKLTVKAFINYSGDNPEYIIITHPSLRTGNDVVGQYADYRRSTQGGSYDVGIYTVDELSDQFGYGIARHPQAIRNFNKMIRDAWDNARMILLIGKAVSYPYSRTHGSSGEQLVLVPTFGQPGADHLLFTEYGVNLPDLPVGRLPVVNQDQLLVYLSKIKEYDAVPTLPQTIEDKGWTKQILHLGGGNAADQQDEIRDYLDEMAEHVIYAPLGAQVTTYTKNSTNATGESNSELMLAILQSGTSLVKFFGHSSAGTLDFQINEPEEWQNKGKYPIFSAMGCKSGDIHQQFISLSEEFVLEPDAGTIAFLAGSGAQYLNSLGDWGVDWYDIFGDEYNTKTLGETIHESLIPINQSSRIEDALLVEQQTLNGDPAIRFHSAPGPDYTWDYRSVRYEPDVVTTELDSLRIFADFVNIGTHIGESVEINVRQKFSDGSTKIVFSGPVAPATSRGSLEFSIPVTPGISGLNTFYFTLDPDNKIEELPDPGAENNNELKDFNGNPGFELFVLDNRAQIVSPSEFSIVVDDQPALVAKSTDAFSFGGLVAFELDTTPYFTSAAVLSEEIINANGIARWTPDYPFQAGKVYYWRVSLVTGNNPVWEVSSFLYQPGGDRGWNQSHHGQFRRNTLNDMDFDLSNQLTFDTVFRNIWVQNRVDLDAGDLQDDPVVYINNLLRRDFYTEYKEFDAQIFVIAIDSFTGRFIRNDVGGLHGSVNTAGKNILVLPYNVSSSTGRQALVTFLEDVVREGMYVIFSSYQRPGQMDYYPESWAQDEQSFEHSIYSIIESQAPESQIRDLEGKGSVPYLLFYRKNHGILYEQIANQLEETLSYDYNFISHAVEGEMLSTMIGPARNWHRFIWDPLFSTIPENDEVETILYAISADFSDTLTFDMTEARDTLLDFIDAEAYPYIRLKFYAYDLFNLTSGAVDRWQVLYEGMPDLLINPGTGFVFENDTLFAGQPIRLVTGIENFGGNTGEPYTVRITITDALNQTTVRSIEMSDLDAGQFDILEFAESVPLAPGKGSLRIDVNPDKRFGEVTFNNNSGILNFVVLPDSKNPLLDVTVDGRHLLNGDIVSPTPVIEAKLQDDSPYLLLDDRSVFEVMLKYPGDFEFTDIDLNGPDIDFVPAAEGQNNIATLLFTPALQPGFYDLFIRATDKSNNQSGTLEYRVTFEVLGESMITRVVTHPTAFNDHTRFVFTVSGSPPSEISIEIINEIGQVVREIGKEELGLFVGTTEFVWDGTTDSGERLPGGVYFYRLTAEDANGNNYPLTGPGIKSVRKGNAGKLVIVR